MKHYNTVQKIYSGVAISLASASAIATNCFADAKTGISNGLQSTQAAAGGTTFNEGVDIVTNILLFVIGLIAVIAIIIGGIKYTTSNGDASQIKSAKDTIMYAVIGLIVAIMSYGIVRWLVDLF